MAEWEPQHFGKNLIHSTAVGVNEFQLLREAWRNAAQASSAVKCANWILPESPTLGFKPSDQMSGIWEDQTEGDICKHCGCVFFSFGQSEDT